MADSDTAATIPGSIDAQSVSLDAVSDVTEPVASIGEAGGASGATSHVGVNNTPPLVVRNMNETAFEEGYDSDGYREPFHTTLERRRELAYEEEEHKGCEISTTEGTVPNSEVESPGAEAPVLDSQEAEATKTRATFTYSEGYIKTLKVADLKEICKMLGLSVMHPRGRSHSRKQSYC